MSSGISLFFKRAPVTSLQLLESNSPSSLNTVLDLWLTLQIAGGLIGLPIVLLTIALSKSVQRNPTVTNLLLTWMISAFSYCLLFMTGQHTGPEPQKDLCLAQSTLVYATIPMNAAAVFSLVLNLWLTIRIAFNPSWGGSWTRWRTPLLIGFPYFVLVAFGTAAFLIGYHNPMDVSRGRKFFYCSIEGHDLGVAVAAFCDILILCVALLEVWICVTVYRKRRAVRNKTVQGFSFGLTFRITVFAIYQTMAGIAALITIWDPTNPFPYLMLATLPLTAFLVFGTQPDIVNVWCVWNRGSTPPGHTFQPLAGSDKMDHDEKIADSEQGPFMSSSNTP
jgi:hypothetical protein